MVRFRVLVIGLVIREGRRLKIIGLDSEKFLFGIYKDKEKYSLRRYRWIDIRFIKLGDEYLRKMEI